MNTKSKVSASPQRDLHPEFLTAWNKVRVRSPLHTAPEKGVRAQTIPAESVHETLSKDVPGAPQRETGKIWSSKLCHSLS